MLGFSRAGLTIVNKTLAKLIAGEQGFLPPDGAAAPGAAADRCSLHRRQRGHVRAHQGLGQAEEGFRPSGGGSSDR